MGRRTNSGNRARILAIAALLLFTSSIGLMSSRPAHALDNPLWGANYFPNIILTTQDGQQVKFYDDLLRNKKFIINFVYTRCGDTCPLETAKLKQVYQLLSDRMGKDIYFYSISIDPKHDTPAVLKDYTDRFHIGPGWYFLTGKKQDIDLIRKKLGMELRPGADALTGHTTALTLGNEAQGQFFVDSSMDDPHYVAAILGEWLSSWQYRKPVKSYAEKPQIDHLEFEKGGTLFRTSCAACHTAGKGDSVGPDLAFVTRVRDREWLKRFIMEPDKALKKKDPIARALYKKYNRVAMPNLRLGEVDAENLIHFLEGRAAELDPMQHGASAPSTGDSLASRK